MHELNERIRSLSETMKRLLALQLKTFEAIPAIEQQEGQQVRLTDLQSLFTGARAGRRPKVWAQLYQPCQADFSVK